MSSIYLMKKFLLSLGLFVLTGVCFTLPSRAESARNPVLYADIPDMAIIRVGDTYYMSSTTMHMSPGLPIMKSKDLVNWTIVAYAYDTLGDVDALNLNNGKAAYGAGSWASSLRYHNGTFYVTTFSQTTGKTYIYTTKDIEKARGVFVRFPRRFTITLFSLMMTAAST
jgi:beta-xylosidase